VIWTCVSIGWQYNSFETVTIIVQNKGFKSPYYGTAGWTFTPGFRCLTVYYCCLQQK
jgi:hypothetical protein